VLRTALNMFDYTSLGWPSGARVTDYQKKYIDEKENRFKKSKREFSVKETLIYVSFRE
jgi:hypothetical protein